MACGGVCVVVCVCRGLVSHCIVHADDAMCDGRSHASGGVSTLPLLLRPPPSPLPPVSPSFGTQESTARHTFQPRETTHTVAHPAIVPLLLLLLLLLVDGGAERRATVASNGRARGGAGAGGSARGGARGSARGGSEEVVREPFHIELGEGEEEDDDGREGRGCEDEEEKRRKCTS